MIPREVLDEIQERANIIDVISNYIKVVRKGDNAVAVCPFHSDKHPSMNISASKRIYKCFACGAGGNVFNFVAEYEKIPFMDAVRKVANQIGFSSKALEKEERVVNPVNKKLLDIIKDANEIYNYTLKTNAAENAQNYLNKRNISLEMQEYFSLGYALPGETTINLLRNKGYSIEELDKAGIILRSGTDFLDRYANRITFPIYNEFNEVVAFSARRINDNDNPKYLLTPTSDIFNKSEILYNYQNAAREAKRVGYIYLCEGFMDVFAMYQAGEKAAVALMGVALTKENAKKIKRLGVEVRLCLDGDNAGQEGQLNMIERLEEERISYRVVNYKDSTLDPDDILQKYGPEILSKFLNRLISKEEFLINFFAKRFDIKSPQGKKDFVKALIPYANQISSEVDRNFFAKQISEITGLDEKIFLSQLNKTVSYEQIDFNTLRENTGAIKSLKRLEKVQNEVFYQMLSSPKAVEDFVKKGNNRFLDKQLDYLSNYVIDLYDQNKVIDASSLITLLSEAGERQNADLIKKITAIISENHIPYDEKAMEQYLDILREEVRKKAHQDRVTSLMKGKSAIEQAQIIDSESKSR
jgi:DNA primase